MKNQKKNIIILLVVLAIILYICLNNDFANVVNEIKKMNPIWLIVSIIYLCLYLLARSINLNMILKQFNKEYTIKKTFKVVLTTSFFDSITPFSSGGQPAQIYLLNKEGFKISDSTNSVIQHSIVYQIALVLFGIASIILNSIFNIIGDNSLLKIFIIIGFAINTFVVIILLFFSFSKKANLKMLTFFINILGKLKIIKEPEKIKKNLNKDIDRFVKNSKLLFKNYKLLIKGILLNLIGFFFLYSIPLYIAFGLGNLKSLNMVSTIVTSSYVMMFGSFIPIPGGSGGIEYGFIKFFGNFISGSKLKAMMLLWRFVTYYILIIVGGISMVLYKKRNDVE